MYKRQIGSLDSRQFYLYTLTLLYINYTLCILLQYRLLNPNRVRVHSLMGFDPEIHIAHHLQMFPPIR